MTKETVGNEQGSDVTRREFMQKAGAAAAVYAAGTMVTTKVLGQSKSPNDKLGIGVIGTGGRGNSHLHMLKWLIDQGDNIEIVAVCDIYKPRREKAAVQYKAKAYDNHHDLLADKNVDVVCIATPDHIHGYQAIDAIEAGKDVYCEKPVTHWRQFELTKKLADVAAKSDQVFQLGTQAMSDSVWHQMKKLVQEGLIGQPLFGETGFFRIGDWGERGMPVDDANAKPGKDLNWEAFLGDSPKREFNVDRFFRWRLFEDYAGGPVTDLYPHSLTQVIDILGVDFPEKVVALGGIHRYDYELREVPDTFNLIAQYPEKVTISVLGTQANDFNATESRGSGQRIPVIRGWDGSLSISGNKEILFTPLRIQGAKEPQRIAINHSEDNIQHWRNLIECCRKRDKQTWSPMDLAFRTQTVLQMAMLSHRMGRTAEFDKAKRSIVI
ncbi:MAG: Gfo/Idh/MocA family oxidoreductase [Sedimentisphaerales bacterium]|nr:Gfo/Idh/MocA family oxidoreductase [Sedimentisphaerales bacterium]